MKLLLAALTLPLLFTHALAPDYDTLAWRATKGAKLRKHFELSMNLAQRDVSITIGDRELPAEMLEKFELSMSVGGTLDVEDEYVSVEDARPTELVRRFETATKTMQEHMTFPGAEPKEKDEELESPLVDHAVAFTWNAADESYERAFRDGEGEKEWLTRLEPDMDLRALLPKNEVEVDETWKIEPSLFLALTMPGGNLSFPKKNDLGIDLGKGLLGTIEATYAGKREVEGHELCAIELDAHLSLAGEREGDTETPMKFEVGFELTGEYLWDSEQGRLHSFELSGPVTMTLSGEREVDVKGQKLPMKLRFALGGELKHKGSFE